MQHIPREADQSGDRRGASSASRPVPRGEPEVGCRGLHS